MFTDVEIIHHEVEVSGMGAVWVLHGQMMGNGVGSVFVPSFVLEDDSFEEEYTTWTNVAHAWCHAGLCLIVVQADLLAGTVTRPDVLQLDQWKWQWLQELWVQHNNDMTISLLLPKVEANSS